MALMNTKIIKNITLEDLPEIYQEVARAMGLENTIRLSELLGGQLIYFPKLDGVIKRKRDEAIKKEFDGANYRELARRYGITEQWIRRILIKDKKKS